jgi:ubiquinone biosynthesis protein COQ4
MATFDTFRIRPLAAVRALRALFRDPDDTAQVFVLIEALSGDSRKRVARRLWRSPVGARLLRERRSLAEVLADRTRLAALPAHSLGRAYLALCERAGITPEGLVAASDVGEPRLLEGDERFVHQLLRDSHDLWHVVTGYQTDTVGEAAVLAFSFAQTHNPGVLLIVLLAMVEASSDRPWVRPLLLQAFARGVRAAWFPAADWEALLERPLEEVRRELGVDAPPLYTPVWSHEYKRERANARRDGERQASLA